MKNILFVDDESTILDGFRRILRGMRGEWDMQFSTSGEAALKLMEQSVFDVIVSDMRMPGMDGAHLLELVRLRWPTTIRFILSGYADMESLLRAQPNIHQMLSKPCNLDLLKEAIQRACGLQEILQSAEIRRVVGEIRALLHSLKCILS